MTHADLDTDTLTKLWDQRWPGCSKVPYELRGARDRWVRFHTLPHSKRYPDSDSDILDEATGTWLTTMLTIALTGETGNGASAIVGQRR